jgi:hypothetical protein
MDSTVIAALITGVCGIIAVIITHWLRKSLEQPTAPSAKPDAMGTASQATVPASASHGSPASSLVSEVHRTISEQPRTDSAKHHYGIQQEIIDAILAAYSYNNSGNWLSAKRQIELLRLAREAKLPDGSSAFPAMNNWDGRDRTRANASNPP